MKVIFENEFVLLDSLTFRPGSSVLTLTNIGEQSLITDAMVIEIVPLDSSIAEGQSIE